jgi:hypothetical protein
LNEVRRPALAKPFDAAGESMLKAPAPPSPAKKSRARWGSSWSGIRHSRGRPLSSGCDAYEMPAERDCATSRCAKSTKAAGGFPGELCNGATNDAAAAAGGGAARCLWSSSRDSVSCLPEDPLKLCGARVPHPLNQDMQRPPKRCHEDVWTRSLAGLPYPSIVVPGHHLSSCCAAPRQRLQGRLRSSAVPSAATSYGTAAPASQRPVATREERAQTVSTPSSQTPSRCSAARFPPGATH